ncbi:MAG: hypothetical protein ACUZ8I_01995, partial [Candidatus Scalindua sp.]
FVEQDERDEKISNRISVLNYQLSALNDRFVVSDTKEIQIAILKRIFGTENEEDEKISNQLKVFKNLFVDSGIDMVQRDIAELIVMMAHKEDKKNKIIASIKGSKKAIQDNKEIIEYTEEAIQRINYNLKQKNGKEL